MNDENEDEPLFTMDEIKAMSPADLKLINEILDDLIAEGII